MGSALIALELGVGLDAVLPHPALVALATDPLVPPHVEHLTECVLAGVLFFLMASVTRRFAQMAVSH